MTKSDRNYRENAIEQAMKSSSRFRVGAYLVNKKYRMGAFNDMLKTHPNTAQFNSIELKSYAEGTRNSIHAEQRVLTRSTKNAGATLYIARVTLTNELVLARPCDMCYTLISDGLIKKVVYSIGDGEWGEIHV